MIYLFYILFYDHGENFKIYLENIVIVVQYNILKIFTMYAFQ